MIVGTMAGFLPPITPVEREELREIYSVYGIPAPNHRPYRPIGPTITEATLVGGGQRITPGEISLAHAGVLFMDELPEYPSKLIDKLRNPMEDNQVSITRGQQTRTYPCKFQLIAAMNPCSCGYYGYGP